MSIFVWFGKEVAKLFHSLKITVAPMVVSILELVQTAEDTGLLPGIAKIIDDMTKGKVAEDINTAIKAGVLNAIALFLGIEGLPANPTEQQEKDFSAAVLNAVLSKKAQQSVPGKVISALGVDIYDIIQKSVAAHTDGTKVTAAEIIEDVELAFQDAQALIAAAQNTDTSTE